LSVPSHFPVTTDAAAMTSIMHISPGAPLELTEDLLTTFNVAAVVRGTVTETGASGAELDERRYAAARKRGIFRYACRCWSRGLVRALSAALCCSTCAWAAGGEKLFTSAAHLTLWHYVCMRQGCIWHAEAAQSRHRGRDACGPCVRTGDIGAEHVRP